jgi:outer membrane receptor protein involved in Fe transport
VSSHVGVAVASVLALAVPRGQAFAANADAAGSVLEEVVVTARKREESLQVVPLSIDVFTKKDIQNLGIAQFDDYAQKVPSISFISVGPGTQLFVMRGVSDGSNPNYANSSATGFFVDDMSTSWYGTQPDLHLYDIAQIEVLNGPQGTTFGAGSMSGAVRYVTNKPDLQAFSAGIDVDAGSIKGGTTNATYEGFLNLPLIEGVLGLRISAFSDNRGGFINNKLETRNWYNGTMSDNSAWARDHYNTAHAEGGRVALKGVLNEKWSASLTLMYQRQATQGAWDQSGARTVSRFGPESRLHEAKMLDLHVDGDVGIGDLVFASTYWSLPTRQNNEYSQYMENYAPFPVTLEPPDSPPVTYDRGWPEGLTCQADPWHGGVPFTGCNVPLQFYEYHSNPERWSNELRLASKPGGRFHWLAGLYWEKTRDKDSGSTFVTPGLQTEGAAFQYYEAYYGTTASSLPPGISYAYRTRSDYLQTTEFANISYDITDRLNVEAGVVYFDANSKYYSPYGQFAYAPTTPSLSVDSSHKVNGKAGINYKVGDNFLLYADVSQGFRDGGANSGFPDGCYAAGVPHSYVPDTLNNFELGWKTTSFGGHFLFNGAAYYMKWKDLQTIIYDPDICAPSSFNANVGDARVYGMESNIEFKPDEHWSIQASGSYTDSHLISSPYQTFQGNVGERLPFVPYFSYSMNVRYQRPFTSRFKAYAQFDVAHKGDMWNDLHVAGAHGIPRIDQPGYSLMNLRVGINPDGGRWLAELYVRNLTDKNAIIYSNTGNFDLRETTNEPRVIGLRLNYRFGKETNSE